MSSFEIMTICLLGFSVSLSIIAFIFAIKANNRLKEDRERRVTADDINVITRKVMRKIGRQHVFES